MWPLGDAKLSTSGMNIGSGSTWAYARFLAGLSYGVLPGSTSVCCLQQFCAESGCRASHVFLDDILLGCTFDWKESSSLIYFVVVGIKEPAHSVQIILR